MKLQDAPWQATQLLTHMATRIVGEDEYLGRQAQQQIGTPVGDDRHDLFIVCEPGEALQQQLEFHAPEYAVLHDIGSRVANRWLQQVAAALKQRVQTLRLRRQGSGAPVAELPFIQIEGTGPGGAIRLYGSANQGEVRDAIAGALLARSRVAVLAVAPMPANLLAKLMQPLHEAVNKPGWNNREMLLVPTAAQSAGLQEAAHELQAGRLLNVQALPAAAHPLAWWPVMQSVWQRHGGQAPHVAPAHAAAAAAMRLPAQPATDACERAAYAQAPKPLALERLAGGFSLKWDTESASTASVAPAKGTDGEMPGSSGTPLAMRPMPRPGQKPAARTQQQLQRYVQACARLRGALAAVCFDRLAPRHPAHTAGDATLAQALRQHGAALLDAAQAAGQALGSAEPEAAILLQSPSRLLLAQALPSGGTIAVAICFDASQANPLLVRTQVQRLAPLLDEA
jgi:hypothetical protein